MDMKKKGVLILLMTFLTGLSSSALYAADASFSFYPTDGIVENVPEGFTVDILINSGGYELSKASAVVKFDPKVLQLTSAMRNNTLFEEWPTDQSSTDNTNGIVMLTGTTSSDGGVGYYKTGTSSDVFARLKFDILDENVSEILLSFEYSGKGELFKSYLLSSSDPAQNVLLAKPASATFVIDEEIVPETSIDMNTMGIIIGVLLILVGGFVRSSTVSFSRKRRGTIVLES